MKKTKIKIIIGSQELIAVMRDNPTAKSFLDMLPATMSFKDFAGNEKISYPPKKMSTQNAPDGYKPAKGDITCYAPWGNLAIFYKAREYASGLIPIGHIESGIEVLEETHEISKAKITLAE